MPGFLETTLHQGYDYVSPVVSPYVEKAQPYVVKVRNNVPMVDPALKKAEELVPVLITRADELAEPHVEKMRPYVEPKLEQAKERVTPYVDEGFKTYGVLREEGVKYYNCGIEKVEQLMEFKDAKFEQVKEFKDSKQTQIKQITEPRVEQVMEFKNAKFEKMKEFKEAQVAQIKEFTDPTVEKIKVFKHVKVNQVREFADSEVQKMKGEFKPKIAVFTARTQKLLELLRLPARASLSLQDPHCKNVMDRVAVGLEKMEALVDRYFPFSEEQRQDSDSDVASASSYVKIKRSVSRILRRPLRAVTLKTQLLLSFPKQLKSSYMDGTLNSKMGEFIKDKRSLLVSKMKIALAEVQSLLTILKSETREDVVLRLKTRTLRLKAKGASLNAKAEQKLKYFLFGTVNKLAPAAEILRQTASFKKAVQMATLGSEKVLGQEKTKTLLSKVEMYIPQAFKASPPAHAKTL